MELGCKRVAVSRTRKITRVTFCRLLLKDDDVKAGLSKLFLDDYLSKCLQVKEMPAQPLLLCFGKSFLCNVERDARRMHGRFRTHSRCCVVIPAA